LFVLETLVLEPQLFDHYLAFDPSLWWNAEGLLPVATARFGALRGPRKQLAVVFSSEPSGVEPAAHFRAALAGADSSVLRWSMSTMPAETHATIYHPAALTTLRQLFAPAGEKEKRGN
jgi:predicted alpha/beta superfamily hydrolase